MQTVEKKMLEAVKGLFKEKKVDIVIGFQNGSLSNARPYFAHCLEDVENLVWNEHCMANLATFLPKLFERPQRLKEGYKPPRIGIIVKGCDGRSVAGLIKENQAPKDSIIIIAMPCSGMNSSAKNKKDNKTDVNRACVECASPVYQAADIIISGESRKPAKSSYARIKAFEAKSPEQRWKAFVEEISKCIRCNACRQACPNCYCKVCFADQRKPSWVSPAAELSDTIVFHLGRMFHQAGRCVECDACVNACPMGIDLRLFTQKLALDSRDLFGCVPGITGDEVPALMTFKQDDSERFITDPEEK